ncbi:hypothetical protein GGQ84_001885 [Desulfitispora alkaliphila]|uniref:hypothetical protein n=1 Tax=Desulfitispora alkaliphila TaxID=622674 RepID=UPI003D1BAF27
MNWGTFNDLPTTIQKTAQLSISGTVIDDKWFSNLTYDSGKPHINAILVLSDIVYWHRPSSKVDQTGQVIYAKKFKADKLQRNYEQIANRFNLTKRQVKVACDYLRDLGLIELEFRTLTLQNGAKIPNMCYITLNIEVLLKYSTSIITEQEHDTFLGNEDIQNNQSETQSATGSDSESDDDGTVERNTNTKITTKINTNTTTNKTSELSGVDLVCDSDCGFDLPTSALPQKDSETFGITQSDSHNDQDQDQQANTSAISQLRQKLKLKQPKLVDTLQNHTLRAFLSDANWNIDVVLLAIDRATHKVNEGHKISNFVGYVRSMIMRDYSDLALDAKYADIYAS